MISKWDMKQFIKKYPESFPYVYNEEEDAIYSKEGNYLCTLNRYLEIYRKHSGESFECIYDEHAFLQSVLRCTECGTVIFTYNDDRYEPHLKCPVCADYKTSFEYWTQDDINSDETKQNTLKFFKEMTDYKVEQDKRIKRRGKYDWEIAVKKFYGKRIFLGFALECNNIIESYLKGLRLKIAIGKKESLGYTVHKHIAIPLSWSQFIICLKFKRSTAQHGKASS